MSRIFLLLLGVGVAGIALLACSHVSESVNEPSRVAPSAHPPKPVAKRPVVDVPSLLALTIDELPARLGRPGPLPANFIDPAVVALNQIQIPLDSVAFFRCRGQGFVVTYNAKTRRLIDVLLLGHDEDLLMQRGHLVPDAASYLMVPVFEVGNVMAIQGIRVIPANLARTQWRR